MPAKAGIQVDSRLNYEAWIPACAGMTILDSYSTYSGPIGLESRLFSLLKRFIVQRALGE
jgi:hypothetical protein